MAYVLVLLVAAAVGGGVYFFTLRRGPIPLPFFGSEAPAVPTETMGSSYVSVSTRPDWQQRVTGILGLAVTVVIAAVALASSVYVSVSWLVRLIGDASKND